MIALKQLFPLFHVRNALANIRWPHRHKWVEMISTSMDYRTREFSIMEARRCAKCGRHEITGETRLSDEMLIRTPSYALRFLTKRLRRAVGD
jgi:hypothetical protein